MVMDKDALFGKITDVDIFKNTYNTYEARKAKRVAEFEGYAVGGDSTSWKKYIEDSLRDIISDDMLSALNKTVDTSVKPKVNSQDDMYDILTYR